MYTINKNYLAKASLRDKCNLINNVLLDETQCISIAISPSKEKTVLFALL